MKIIFSLGNIENILEHADHKTLTLYAVRQYIYALINSNTELFNSYASHEILLTFPYTDEDGIAGHFQIDFRTLDFFNRYDLRLITIFKYLTMRKIPAELHISVNFYLGNVSHHSNLLPSLISKGRVLDDLDEVERYLDCIPLIYDLDYFKQRFFDSNCRPMFKILLLAALADHRLPDVIHPLSALRLSYWDNRLTDIPHPLPDKCIGDSVDLIDFYHAAELNLRKHTDIIIHYHLKNYVNAHMDDLFGILLSPNVNHQLKKSIFKTFRLAIFYLIRYQIEQDGFNLYSATASNGQSLALLSPKNCVIEWLNCAKKTDFMRALSPFFTDYYDTETLALMLAGLNKSRREWIFDLQLPDTNKVISNRYSINFFAPPTTKPHYLSLSKQDRNEFLSLQDRLLRYVMNGMHKELKTLLQSTMAHYPDFVSELILQEAESYEHHANRHWKISPLAFAAWAGDIYIFVTLIGSLPFEINIMQRALLQLQGIMQPNKGSDHGCFMAPYLILRNKYHGSEIMSMPRQEQFKILGQFQKILPLHGLQSLCNPSQNERPYSFDKEPLRVCRIHGGYELDLADLSQGWLLSKHTPTQNLPYLEAAADYANSRAAKYQYLTMQTMITHLYASRKRDFELEMTCLQNIIKQLQEANQTKSVCNSANGHPHL